jgi:hypothetical protein
VYTITVVTPEEEQVNINNGDNRDVNIVKITVTGL